MERKNFLKAFVLAAAAGPMIVDSCKKESVSTSTSSSSTSDSSCIVTPSEEEGPYPYVGGELTNPLDRSSITEGTQTGVALSVVFTVVNTDSNCIPVENVRVDVWHCNKDGYYSGYANQNEALGEQSYVGQTWLRGYQLTDSSGLAKFSTIYPGWYTGRATHFHIEVYINGVLKKTGQLAFPEATSNLVHTSTLYAAHGVNPITNTADRVFGNSATDLADETFSLTGSVSAGYTGTYTIGLAL
jgi:protocatechuate 3,4-dioxygenase beta subunit